MKKEWGGKIPIGGWVTPWPKRMTGKEYITVEAYREVKACGIDFLHTLYENGRNEEYLQALDCAEQAGVFLYIHDDRFFKEQFTFEEGRALIEKLSKKKSFLGLNIKDEPCSNDFEKLKNVIVTYENYCDTYVNLLPVYAVGTQLVDGIWTTGREATEEEYEKYLTEFLDSVPAKVLSYDFYPFKDLTYGSLDKRYFYQLHIAKKMADERGIPLWNFVQVTSFNPAIRVMSEAEMFWCVTTSLAFGVTGLQYFTYYTPFASNTENFKGAIIDENGKPSCRYETAKECNAHVNALGNVLINAAFKGVIASGEYTDLIPKERKIDSFGALKDIVGDNYLIGCFEKDGKDIYYLVNTSLMDSAQITLEFAEEKQRFVVENDKQMRVLISSVSFELLAGRGVLIYE